MKTTDKIIIWAFTILSLGIGYKVSTQLGQTNNLISARIDGKDKQLLTKDSLLDSMASSNDYNRTRSIEIIHSVLSANFGNKYRDLAQKRYAEYSNGKNQNLLNQSLQAQGMTPRSYLDSIENVLTLQHVIYSTYKPSKSEINNYYKKLHAKYWIEGVYITPTGNDNSFAKNKAISIKNQLSNNKKYKLSDDMNKSSKHYDISGIGLGNSTQINQISSNDYATIPDYIAKRLTNKSKPNDVFMGYNSDKGYYVIKIVKIDKVGSVNKEKSYIVDQIKQDKSESEDYQTKFIAELFKKEHVSSSNKDMNNEIKNMIKEGLNYD